MDLSAPLLTVILLSAVIFMVGTGMWIGVALGVAGLIGVIFLAGAQPTISAVIVKTLNSYTMAAVPLFIFMGELILMAGISQRLYKGLSKVTTFLPGGLTQTNIAASAMFAAVCGTSTATAATITTVAYPEQKGYGYNQRLIVGSLAAGGTLGPMIPPSITMILYGYFTSTSVGKLFIGTAIPGIIMALIYMTYIGVRFLLDPSLGPKREAISLRFFRELISSLQDIWPVGLIMVIIFGGIYGGFMTATESAAVSGVVAILLGAIFGKLNFTVLREAAFKALEITAMVFLIVVSANMLGTALSLLRIPAQLVTVIAASGLDPLLIWGLIIVMYLMLGMFMCVISMMFVTLPIVFPLMMGLGFDPIWLGVVLGITLETGLLTPPVGMNLFVIQGVSKVPFMEVVKGSFPFFLLMLFNIALITFVPQLATWLPSTMLGR